MGGSPLEIKGCVVSEGLVSDEAALREGEAFYLIFGVGQHVPQHIRSENE